MYMYVHDWQYGAFICYSALAAFIATPNQIYLQAIFFYETTYATFNFQNIELRDENSRNCSVTIHL